MRGKKTLKTRELMSTFDISSLPKLPIIDRFRFPKIPCVYIAIKDDVVLYVGKTKNLYRRFPSHHRLNQLCSLGGVSIAWVDCSCGSYHLEKLEDAVTMFLQPKLNETPVTPLSIEIPPNDEVEKALETLSAHKGFTVLYNGHKILCN